MEQTVEGTTEQMNLSQDKTLLDELPDPVAVIDSQGILHAVNQRLVEFTGLSAEQLVGSFVGVLGSVVSKEEILRLCTSMKPGEIRKVLNRLCRADGSHIPVEVSLRVFQQEGRNFYIGSIRDLSDRTGIEKELLDREKRFRFMVNQASDAMFLHDEDGHLLDVNDQACLNLGYSKAELLRMNVDDIDTSRLRGDHKTWKGTRLEVPLTFTGVHKRKDGRSFPVEVRLTAFEEEGRKLYIAFARDITVRYLTEARAADSECQFRTIFESEPDCVKTVGRDGKVLDVNEAGLGLVEATYREQFVGQDPTPLVDEEYREAFRQLHERAFEGHVGQLEFGATTLKGNHRWFSMKLAPMRSHDGSVQSVLALSRDITHTRLQEELLIKVLRATAGETGGRFFEMMTRSAAELFGVEHAFVGEVINREADDVPHRVRTLQFYSNGKFRDNVEYCLRGAPCEGVVDGSLCHVESNVTAQFPEDEGLKQIGATSYLGVPLRSEDGKVIGIFAVMGNKILQCNYWIETLFRIIAARISAELERIQARARQHELEIGLQNSQKLQSLGTLAGGIAHDFNNILCVMMTNLEIALEDQAQNVLDASPLQEIQQACRRARSLVKQILTFSRAELPQFERVSLGEVIQDAMHLLRSIIPSTVTLDLSIQPDLPLIQADPGQMRQILTHLCTNAWQAMERGQGRIEVSLALHQVAGSSEIQLEVADNGIGMDLAVQQRIFEPFFTTKPPGVGTGLGLSVVHGIVEQHRGRIRLKSQPGQGARFIISLPVLDRRESRDKDHETVPSGLSVLLCGR